METGLSMRKARPEDAELIAWCVLRAVGMEKDPDETLLGICRDNGTLYSWKNTMVGTVGGEDIGCLVSYPGESYAQARKRTIEIIGETCWLNSPGTPMETGDDEYYLDSLAILPRFRGHGYGALMMKEAMTRAHEAGWSKVTLLVEEDHPELKSYYAALGFKDCGRMFIFGADYIKMQSEK